MKKFRLLPVLLVCLAVNAYATRKDLIIENNCATGTGATNNVVAIVRDYNGNYMKHCFADQQKISNCAIDQAERVTFCTAFSPSHDSATTKDKRGNAECYIAPQDAAYHYAKNGNNTYRDRLFSLSYDNLKAKDTEAVRVMLSSGTTGVCNVHTQAKIAHAY